jgi:ribosomal protein S18 acetylase RimI-like enzyme
LLTPDFPNRRMTFTIEHTIKSDLDFVYWLFEQAILYQTRNNYPAWKGYDKGVLQRDVEHQRQYKIVTDGKIACIFSILFSDDLLWTDLEKDDAIYIHRVVVNPEFKGNQWFEKIVRWAIPHARENNRTILRMDTWANNPNIIAYYKNLGFKFLHELKTSDNPELPVQNRNLNLAMLEMRI